ncbi:phosphoadenylyl-sulfate reductase [Sneathiella aquimaris]|uniref:phosphoadenylyl-sulfate reductase n=1 Tax=Sneathiella aquimaris TaxID=2599305 RepID=UPI00146E0431|nr:phosphoadenylyl-sulfate reductase [Sneathiella aquimaris]
MFQTPDFTSIEAEAARLRGLFGHLEGAPLLEALLENGLAGKIMMTSSFGAEAIALLDLVAQVDSTIPVIFLDTRRLFGETLRYQRDITELLGLEDVRIIRPDSGQLERIDPDDMLFASDPDKCCEIRKVKPLDNALTELQKAGFTAWITGRKRFQANTRGALETIEASDGFLKINPLAHWTDDDVKTIVLEKNLPPHPLVADGFLSIGCMPCTERVAAGGDARSGRWAGKGKTECGIHVSRTISPLN